MKIKWCVVSCAIAAQAMACAAEPDCKNLVMTGGPDYPPLHWFEGEVMHGASARIAQRIFADMGVPTKIIFVGPFARVLLSAKAAQVDVVTTLKDTPERRQFLQFTAVPAFQNPIAVFVGKNSKIRSAELGDLIGYKGGVVNGTSFGSPFDEALKSQLRTETAPTEHSNFDKLALGRIDYVVSGYYNGNAYLASHGPADAFKALRPFVGATGNYVGFVKSSPCMKYFDEFNRRLAVLVKSGVAEQYLAEASLEWEASLPARH
jgi:polar amino acid transport system substrate-binding protein